MEINAKAPAVARHQIVINAPIETVWQLLSGINQWSIWQQDISNVKLDGSLATGSVFRWKSGGATIISQIQEIEPPHRLGWTGKAMGANARHLWTLAPKADGVLVKVEESFDGLVVLLLRGMMQKNLDTSLQSWLRQLKGTAENRK
jgi:uncharacterized protein YndB with AHSA1/START domain